jgi:hypothetical protein
MKTLSILALVAALAAFFATAPLEIFVSGFFAAGLIAVLVLDYGYCRPALKLPARARRAPSPRFLPPPLKVESHQLAA